jgi:hypothetical protein
MGLTDRVNNENIINLARQQYEAKQKSKLPTVIVNLPSQGKIYPKTHPLSKGSVEMRYMTAYDEDIITNTSYIREGVMFDKLLEAIIVTEVNVDDIATVDKDALIINAKILAYGSEYPVIVTNPATKQTSEKLIDLSKIKHVPFTLENDVNGEFDYVTDKFSLKFSYFNTSTPSDIDDVTVSGLLKQIIREVNGNRNANEIENFIRYEFLSPDSKKFREYYIKNTPRLDYNYEFEGESGDTFTTTFQVGADLFWI